MAGVWMWDGDVAVSQSISDMVGRQLRELTPDVALVVDTLSQCEPLAVDALCDLVGRADLEVAEQMRLVTIERPAVSSWPGWHIRCTANCAGRPRAKCTCRRSAASWRCGSPRMRTQTSQATVRRALLALESDLPPDPQLYLQSAQYAMTLMDLDLADRFATAAAAAGAPEAWAFAR